jgi:hypothetical protein
MQASGQRRARDRQPASRSATRDFRRTSRRNALDNATSAVLAVRARKSFGNKKKFGT